MGEERSPSSTSIVCAESLLSHEITRYLRESENSHVSTVFSDSLSQFLELMGVGGSGDRDVLRQQLPVQHAPRISPAAEEKLARMRVRL